MEYIIYTAKMRQYVWLNFISVVVRCVYVGNVQDWYFILCCYSCSFFSFIHKYFYPTLAYVNVMRQKSWMENPATQTLTCASHSTIVQQKITSCDYYVQERKKLMTDKCQVYAIEEPNTANYIERYLIFTALILTTKRSKSQYIQYCMGNSH